jgi:hypothetical protein
MVWVTEAKYVEQYKIWLKFNDNLEATIDFEPIFKDDTRKIISDLLKTAIFRDFTVAIDTLTWSNSADFTPKYLYDLCRESKYVA